ncbi:DUF3761 domain-containing protein [Fibrella sp. USSR17]
MHAFFRLWLLVVLLVSGIYQVPVEAQTPASRSTHRPYQSRSLRPAQTRPHWYTNSQGKRVQSPTFYSVPPARATAECRDGSYSFSQSRRGTCSRHGGVKRWL